MRDNPVCRLIDAKRTVNMIHLLRPHAVDESYDYIHFLVPYENEDSLPLMLAYLKVSSAIVQ